MAQGDSDFLVSLDFQTHLRKYLGPVAPLLLHHSYKTIYGWVLE